MGSTMNTGDTMTGRGKPQFKRPFFNVLIPALAMLALASCTTMQAYPGAKLPREKIAVIERRAQIVTLIYGMTIYIGTIDGAVVDATASEIELLPGMHEMTLVGQVTHPLLATPVVLLLNPKFEPNKLTFRAEAGRSYRLVTGEVETNVYVVWVEDEEQSVVGGVRVEPKAPSKEEREREIHETE
jgi:hypothetical protein